AVRVFALNLRAHNYVADPAAGDPLFGMSQKRAANALIAVSIADNESADFSIRIDRQMVDDSNIHPSHDLISKARNQNNVIAQILASANPALHRFCGDRVS